MCPGLFQIDVFNGFFESGFSFANGSRFNQGDERTNTESFGGDARFEKGPWTARIEFDYSDIDQSRNGASQGRHFYHWYAETFYEIPKPGYVPGWVPMVNLTPYYRFDTRYSEEVRSTLFPTTTPTDVGRSTLGLRYILRPGTMFKTEYEWISEKGAKVNDDIFLASFVQEF